MQTFPSKIDGHIWFPLAALLLSVTILVVLLRVWPAVAFLVLVDAFVASIFFKTVYAITADERLVIRCGFLFRKEIEIRSIIKVTHITNPLASPALSTQRLEVAYNRWDTIMISPRQEERFLCSLKEINAGIEIA